MAYQIFFDKLHLYDAGKNGISIPVKLAIGEASFYVEAKLDTGASHCIFHREIGESLGLKIENGYRIEVSTANGLFTAYGHNITLSVLDYAFDSMIYFAKDEDFTRDVLGRQGFLNKVQIGVRDYQGELYLSRNDS